MSEICYCVCAVALAVEWVACYACADRQGSDWLGVLKCDWYGFTKSPITEHCMAGTPRSQLPVLISTS